MKKATSDAAGSPLPLPFPAVVLLIVINLLWAGSQVAAKAALDAVGPFTLAELRFAPAGLLLLALARLEGPLPAVRRADRRAFAALALLGIALTYGIFYIGVDRTTATDSSLLFACEPILIALFARLFLGERLNGGQWGGLLCGLVGIWLIAGQALGNQIALLALCFEAMTSILGKRLTQSYPGLFVVALEMLIGSLLLLPLSGVEIARNAPSFSWQAVGGVLYLSLICSALCYGVWYHLMARYPVSTMAVFILLQPMAGPFYGRLFRGETLSRGSALGGALVVAGIALTTLRSGRQEAG